MNYRPVTALVTSSDGVQFAVATDDRAIPYEIEFAKAKHSAELDAHADFMRVSDAQALTEVYNAPALSTEPELALPAVTQVEALARARRRWGRAEFAWGDKT